MLVGLDIARILLGRRAAPNPKLLRATPGRGIPDGEDPLLRRGTTPFLRAAKTGDVRAMRLLLDHDADPNNERPLLLAVSVCQSGCRGPSQIPGRSPRTHKLGHALPT